MLVDYHIHTSWSHGEMTVSEVVNKAKELNLNAIAITDHANKNSEWIPSYVAELNDLKKRLKGEIDLIIGIEVKMLDFNGRVDFNVRWLSSLDVILIAIHRIPGVSTSDLSELSEDLPHMYAELIISAIEKVNFSIPVIIAHPGKWLIENGLPFIPREYWGYIADAARSFGKIVEYNTSAPPPKEFVDVLLSNKVKMSVGSDAHSLSEVGFGVAEAANFIGDLLVKPKELLRIG